jgi:CRISPR-associated endonuclease/helicase Cas3
MTNQFFAHSLPPPHSIDEWEPLNVHLDRVAKSAGDFASAFGARDWGHLAGLWHDMGKYSLEFQAYIKASNDGESHLEEFAGKVDHSTAGAQHANASFRGPAGRILAYCIAGHHAGLTDAETEADSCLSRRLRKEIPSIEHAPHDILKQREPCLPSFDFSKTEGERAFQAAMFCRMVFSCLVDADFLATEKFMSPVRAEGRDVPSPDMPALEAAVLRYLDTKIKSTLPTPVNQRRREVLEACLAGASKRPGLFSLTVPTGGGKTLTSLAMALRHARLHGMSRVIYAIPFTSIIEQNAQVFLEVLVEFGRGAVLEHHSNLEPRRETTWSRLATENWDAPIVVTTNVQFFESLFAAKTSRCRKLHHIAGSVIVLDEAQTLPIELLQPCLAAIHELCRNYHCSVVLCSATQPAVEFRDDFPIGLQNVEELIAEPNQLADTLKRVHVETVGQLTDVDLAQRLENERQVLCIVSTRRHAAALHALIRDKECLHLSAQMCPRHRSSVIRLIRRKLRQGKPCRVVSTQLVEAGVDLDFPVVYRALAGLDSIAQAAGRCDREGKLTDAAGHPAGRVIVFTPEHPIPDGFLRQAAETTSELIGKFDDLLGLDAIEEYFRLHYWKRQALWDKHGVMACFKAGGKNLDFRQAAELFRFIDQTQKPVVVPWGRRGRHLREALRRPLRDPARDLAKLGRQSQRYIVQIPERTWNALLDAGELEICHEKFPVLIRQKLADLYDRQVGLRPEIAGIYQPEELIG